MVHEIKIEDQFADAVFYGDKTFEVRYNDRGYNKGDIVRFLVMDSQRIIPGYITAHPLHGAQYQITYVLSGWGIKDDYVCFGIRPVEREGRA